ncbi:zeta toxin family protein [Mycolicibacterium chlorophenolicum]|uniref:UDP-N-acetylglucosamine kinase n=1 Tax=Mycolicibacterium chlorophenolicum TaxID=37916 RepID=A0A0J6W1Y2_9MYCO|nr:zeta toxin family protein [Mycolicibacterium chlorophenolicum]KMO75692.1 Zeta toxin [Mycolicibacterium chlorophenolicum]
MRRDAELRAAVTAELAGLTAAGGPLAPDSPRATYKLFEDDPRRARVRKRIIAEFLDTPGSAVRAGNAAVITAGAAGAGKSTAIKAVLGATRDDYRRLDADDVKDHLLNDALATGLFDDLLSRTLVDGRPIAPRELAALVHHESTQIWDALWRHCIGRGEQIVIEGTLSWPPLGAILLRELRAGGYATVRVIAVDVPESVAQQRAIDRWWSVRSANTNPLGGRFTPPDVIASAYQPDKSCICTANAVSLITSGSQIPQGLTVTVDVVDELGTVTRPS